jgi:hypothetical protein
VYHIVEMGKLVILWKDVLYLEKDFWARVREIPPRGFNEAAGDE